MMLLLLLMLMMMLLMLLRMLLIMKMGIADAAHTTYNTEEPTLTLLLVCL
jgi:hypothetical protein